MASPYENLPKKAYWRSGVVDQHPLNPVDLYEKKFEIKATDRIATAGSCFAQHIARHMRASGFTVLDLEPAPKGIDIETAQKFGYGLYSCRYGNLYTSRQLLQLFQESCGKRSPSNAVWQKGDRFFDALRPSVEPSGLPSEEEVNLHRTQHLKHVAQMFRDVDVFIFTLGLTETWEHIQSGTVYPSAPGVIAGEHDPASIRFKNLSYPEVLEDFIAFRDLIKTFNPNVRFLLTVSPVPLTATGATSHVLPATIYSKSVLRAAAGYLYDSLADVDYFPSYEIIAAHPSRGFFYENNLRSVASQGVEVVMRSFFSQHKIVAAPKVAKASSKDVVCEEALLEAFS
ncbi:GSCFA domain-containing protein [Rhizobium sp. Root482]|uniref:GSCFA domain-containing protein n=1 Tax=Rhizobium sp. Root482 TaxID=1736543 RepID=UPI0006FFE7B7|nr:GSCFA domain-containing protein [Rhizobium sp. Root482]KQY27170.1 hypothetical protein ASD31_03015 [Rhizobium sp. Root482]